jgi:hypothetical protein
MIVRMCLFEMKDDLPFKAAASEKWKKENIFFVNKAVMIVQLVM